MNIRQAKEIPLEEVLARLGHSPAHRRGKELWYRSPLRSEATPSFKTNERNQWYDFATGKHGDVLDLIQELNNLTNVKDALGELRRLLGEPMPEPRVNTPSIPNREACVPEIIGRSTLRSRSLVQYLEGRGLSHGLCRDHLRELRYRRGDSEYFALAFKNDRGGFELRTSRFKGSLGNKAISTRCKGGDIVAVFEGFTDYLTALSRSLLNDDTNVIVMNSAAMKDATVNKLAELHPKAISLWLDHDATGRQTTSELSEAISQRIPDVSVVDRSDLYAGHHDLNAFHVASLRCKNR
ncbi:MAG: toprim domain-containing protein [Planctomycetota bacterium]